MTSGWLRRSSLLLLLPALLVACSLTRGAISPAPTSTGDGPTATAQLPGDGTQAGFPDPGSLTPSPKLSPTPAEPLVILLAPDGADTALAAEVQSVLAELAGGDLIDLEVRSSITPEAVHPGIRLLVALPPDPGLVSLAASAPVTQFLAVGVPGLQPAGNLSLISLGDSQADQIGFLAGYTAAVVTPEWRVGVIGVSDTPAGVAARQGFLNGVIFFCGLCRQTYPPYHNYPLFVELPASASPAEWQAAAQTLLDQSVKTVYVVPGAGDEALLAFLAEADVNLIGAGPPPSQIHSHWIASVRADLARSMGEAWPELIKGNGGVSIPVSLEIADINEELFSPGRQVLVDELLQDLLGGFIATGVDSAGSQNP